MEAINLEFKHMEEHGVWTPVLIADKPKNKRLIGSKQVLKIKDNGVYHARLVGQGYTQIPGLDFTDLHSPVINDITLQILLILWILNNWDAEQIDVKTAFLNGELEEEIYMRTPKGMNLPIGYCLLLNKSIYGLVQAS